MGEAAISTDPRAYTPPLGKAWLTPLYDSAIGLFTRERRWRAALVREARLSPVDRLLDVGCGTGSLLYDLMVSCPQAELIGVDPDRAALAIAKRKMGASKSLIRWHEGFLDSLVVEDRHRPNKIVSSLVFHQVPERQKRAILEQMHDLLQPGGMLLIADYMRQETVLMRRLFRATVQQLDGVRDTQPNADGIVERHLADLFDSVERLSLVPTATGAISLWRGTKKGTGK
ncbi:UbiE/COQ5 methyltransferase [Aurantiacibacter atlanticus]|uniref:UbiE/COQ5 methyltransferase n=1 Tax=Aurantiacibacter atlanticus TaxID=1648404 RepID=A0A0H4VFQ0_9SPHN|nr:class I SAM-dependent methyltransferase [Aurantiacibacter atlanticus]AKQ41646.1 UbiE/COQ5 methyltransferase [Aurantiacibacter atlanticus]